MTPVSDTILQLTNLVRQNMSSKMKEADDFQWDVNVEILFLHSLTGLKPVGVNKNWTMLDVQKRFSSFMQKEISSDILWTQLNSMYDMAALHESESIPFPNEQKPFELSKEFDDIVRDRFGIVLKHTPNDENLTENGYTSKDGRKSNSTKLRQPLPTAASSSKSTFLSPGAVKSTKSTDSQSSSAEPSSRMKQESLAKSGKVKLRASSPVSSRSSALTVKEESSDSSAKKKNEIAAGKKAQKSEPSVANSSKKSEKVKTEPVKSEKVKQEKEVVGKRGKPPSVVDNSSSKKSTKVDGKRTEGDSIRKSVDTPNLKSKPERSSIASSKNSRNDGLESPVPSGSKKQSLGRATPVLDTNDKKRRRSKVDDSAKKATPVGKRRRI